MVEKDISWSFVGGYEMKDSIVDLNVNSRVL